MQEKARINLLVDDDIPELLASLAGGRNLMGEYISKLVRTQIGAEVTADELKALEGESLRLMVQGLAGRVKMIEGEIMKMRAQLADLPHR